MVTDQFFRVPTGKNWRMKAADRERLNANISATVGRDLQPNNEFIVISSCLLLFEVWCSLLNYYPWCRSYKSMPRGHKRQLLQQLLVCDSQQFGPQTTYKIEAPYSAPQFVSSIHVGSALMFDMLLSLMILFLQVLSYWALDNSICNSGACI